ncbi:hypothetical protein Kpol_1028p55 [Vanderwaltozyma polyspora DSM 70294]|uniref:Ataxin-10 homolog n=1 Tax=Vanderwaltozyma polyspora (strain ATCC 22028 / DSM 70294 / BCRC 21397 / CBS 2163 / NBRC 10782 / NRRL Y-8283 / UCD 57-17) TaxID=436907 RepID=A7TG23_VANPO|nr:uncharacterized protein Kpol_1028p55 [Vanderwaltozyma polyspora DSM 70294]EDO18780.1 hypothetical protein Kpol_1028p55 [Vanderwaltozyma polyspora DSM 70294]
MVESVVKVIDDVGKLLEECPSNIQIYQDVLVGLGTMVSKTSEDEKYRETLANNRDIWVHCRDSLRRCISDKSQRIASVDVRFIYLRTLRGLILLLRNLSASNQEIARDLLIQNTVINSFTHVTSLSSTYEEIEVSLFIITSSLLHNITKGFYLFDKTTMDEIMIYLKYPLLHKGKQLDLIYPYVLFFLNLSYNDDFLYHFYRHKDVNIVLRNIILEDIVVYNTSLHKYMNKRHISSDIHNLSSLEIHILKLFSRIASNESFAPYFEQTEKDDEEYFFKFFKLMQLVVTSHERWDKYQLTAIMAWCYRIFEQSAESVKQYFELKKDDESIAIFLHEKLTISLDIMSKLSEYEHVQKFILFYQGLEKLIELFRILQENLIKINFHKDNKGNIKDIKSTNSLGDKITSSELLNNRVDYKHQAIKATNFPECKSLLVEILSNLTFENKEVQDNIRELRGLELILSNCVIDDNDPFIKERSIMCIRFLLTENKENQSFVADLEAKKAVQDETLSEAGYEVKIDENGNVGLVSNGKEGPLPKKPKI